MSDGIYAEIRRQLVSRGWDPDYVELHITHMKTDFRTDPKAFLRALKQQRACENTRVLQ